MEKSNLVVYLFLLSPDEMARFRHFLSSPFHNKGELPIQLFDFLKEEYDQWEQGTPIPAIPLPKAYEALYGKTEFKGQRLRRVKMELLRLLTSFIHLLDDRPFHPDFSQEYHLRKFLLDRGGLQLFQKRSSKPANFPVTPDLLDPTQHWEGFQMGLLNYEYCIHAGIPTDDMESTLDHFDQYYFASKLRLWASILNREKGYDQKHQLKLVDETLRILESPIAKNWKTAHLWKHVLGLVRGDNASVSYQNLEEMLLNERLPRRELRQVRGFMYNYLNSEKKGGVETYRNLWKLLKTMLEEGTLHSNDRINGPFFRATIFNACLAGESTWAGEFLDRYGQDLKGAEVERENEYFRLHIAFFQGRFGEVSKWARQLKFKSKRFEIYLRALQLKAAYELDEVDDFFRLGNAFQKYLASKQEPASQFVKRYVLFIKLVQKLGWARFDRRSLPESFAEELPELGTAERAWLMEKCSDLHSKERKM